MKAISRRQVLESLGFAAGASLWSIGGNVLQSAETPEVKTPNRNWNYVSLAPEVVAAEAYRLFADGGCMYGLFGAVVSGLADKLGEPFRSFPIHMMRYGKGGVGGWGSICGTLNGAAAVIGLVEARKEPQAQLVVDLFSWYETTALPTYRPNGQSEPPSFPTSSAGSVLCHLSLHRWCQASGCEVESDEMKERCRRLTADVASRTVELLNRNLATTSSLSGPSAEVKSCMACHGKEDRADAFGAMRCNACHQLSPQHPDKK